jgi:hypothetical protein
MEWILFGCIWSVELSAVLLVTAVIDLADGSRETRDLIPITYRRQSK